MKQLLTQLIMLVFLDLRILFSINSPIQNIAFEFEMWKRNLILEYER